MSPAPGGDSAGTARGQVGGRVTCTVTGMSSVFDLLDREWLHLPSLAQRAKLTALCLLKLASGDIPVP